MWLGLVYLVALCVFDSSAVRPKRSLFDGVRVCGPAATQNYVVLSTEPTRTVCGSGSYRGQECNPAQSQDFRKNPDISQFIVEHNPTEQLSRCARSVKDNYGSWDSGHSRSSKQRWSSRSARDREIMDEEDDEEDEDKAFSSLPKGRYLLIPTTSNLEDILKSKDPQFKTSPYPPTTTQQVRRNSERLAQESYGMDSLGFQTETPPVQQVPAFDQNCPQCNKKASAQKTMSTQPMNPKYFKQLLQANPNFVKKILEENSLIRQRRFSGNDRKAKSASLSLAEKVDPQSNLARPKPTPIVNPKAYSSSRNVVGNPNKPISSRVPSKKSILELFPKHLLQEIQGQVPRSLQPANNVRNNFKENPQSSQIPQHQRTAAKQNTRFTVPSQLNEPHARQNLQTPSSLVGHGSTSSPASPERNLNLRSVPKGITVPVAAASPAPSTMPSTNRMSLPNQEIPQSTRFPTMPSSENMMQRRPQEARALSKTNPPAAAQVPAPTAPSFGEMSRSVDVSGKSSSLPAPDSVSASSKTFDSGTVLTKPSRPPPPQSSEHIIGLPSPSSANTGSNLSETPTNSATPQDTPTVKNVDFARQENTDIIPNSK